VTGVRQPAGECRLDLRGKVRYQDVIPDAIREALHNRVLNDEKPTIPTLHEKIYRRTHAFFLIGHGLNFVWLAPSN